MNKDSSPPPRELASQLIAGYGSRQPFNTRDLLEAHPELLEDRSAVITLAYEEFCRRQEAGEPVDPQDFADGFSQIRRSLVRLIELDGFLQQHSELAIEMQEGLWPDAGTSYEGFQLHEEIGRGALSRVFVASETRMGGRRVVAKVCWRGAREASCLGRLEHPGVVPVHSIQGAPDSQLSVICMPLLSRATLFHVGETLFAKNARPSQGREILEAVSSVNSESIAPSRNGIERMTYPDAVAQIGIQLAEALVYTHERKVFHCDIKPTNVLVTSSGQAMLLDFNLSVEADGDGSLPGGTLPYMPPEHLRTMLQPPEVLACPVTARLDLFSLGATLFELLAGLLPYGHIPPNLPRHMLAEYLVECHRKSDLRRLRDLNPQVPSSLAGIIERCLQTDPLKRPATAAELAGQLRRYLSRPRRLGRWCRRHRKGIAGSLLSSAAALTLFACSDFGSHKLQEWGVVSESDEFIFETQLEAAREDMRHAHFASALERLQEAEQAAVRLKSPHDQVQIITHIGACHLEVGDFQSAIRTLERATSIQPTGLVHEMLGYALAKMKKYELGLDQLERAAFFGRKGRALATNHAYCIFKLNLISEYESTIAMIKACDDWEKDARLTNICGICHFGLMNARNFEYQKTMLNSGAQWGSRQSQAMSSTRELLESIEIHAREALNCFELAAQLAPEDSQPSDFFITIIAQVFDQFRPELQAEILPSIAPHARKVSNPNLLNSLLDRHPELAKQEKIIAAITGKRQIGRASSGTELTAAPPYLAELSIAAPGLDD